MERKTSYQADESSMFRANLCLVFLIGILQFSACSPVQQTNVAYSVPENNQNNESNQNIKPNNKSTQNVEADLEKNRQLWNEKNITNYNVTASFVMDGVNFSADPVLIKVRAGKAISMEPVSNSDKGSTMLYKRYETVEKMFDAIGQESKKPTSIRVIYNKELNYPENISFAYENKPSHAWSSFKITNFEIIK